VLVCLSVFKTGVTPKSVRWVRFLHAPASLGSRVALRDPNPDLDTADPRGVVRSDSHRLSDL